MQVTIEPIIDPRGIQDANVLTFAPRKSVDELKGAKILFFDNTKLAFCNYAEVFVGIKAKLCEMGITNFVDHIETVRGTSSADLQCKARELALENYGAAFVALADMGTSPASTILTIELEKAGVPAILISAPPGAQLANQVGFYRARQLCLCELDIYQASSKAEIRVEVEKHINFIVRSLTLSVGELAELCALVPVVDRLSPPADGLQHLSVERLISLENTIEPGLCMEEVMDLFDSLNLGDGLPVIPPTRGRVAEMMKYVAYNPEHVLIPEAGPSGKDILVQDVVINAVMAGCRPEYMPVIITVFQAMAEPKYNFLQSTTTSHPSGNLIVVSGPLAQELKIHGGQGCLGPGFRANATIGRAVNLTIINACRSVPGKADLACLGSPAEYAYCFAEDPALNPWPTINAERFDNQTTTVLVLKAETPSDVIDFLSQSSIDLLDGYISSSTCLGKNNAYIPGNLIVVLTPDHAKILEKEGWDKPKLRKYLHERVHNHRALVRHRGIIPVRPAEFDFCSPIPATRSPDDIEIVAVGGRGGHAAVIAPWGLHSEAVVKAVRLPSGEAAKHIRDFI